ncbi:MAG: hypothetical protein KJ064_25700 [Anaerolineae bacterium]|nr:hypothetical protein [Anaerolineae bacterium]
MSDTARMLEYDEARAAAVGLQVTTVVFTAKALPMILYNRVLCLGIVELVTQEIISELVSPDAVHAHLAKTESILFKPDTPGIPTCLPMSQL